MFRNNRFEILIWVPFGKEKGLGHYYRNFHIYEKFANASYLFTDPYDNSLDVSSLSLEFKEGADLEEQLLSKKTKVLIIDNYFIDDDIVTYFSKTKRLKTIFFDRFQNQQGFSCLLNSNPFSLYNGPKSESVKFFGIEFYGFRDSVVKSKLEKMDKKKELMTCFGGTDHLDLAGLVAENINPTIFTTIISSSSSILTIKKNNITVLKNPKNFLDIMNSCEYGLLSCSTLVYEAFYLGVKVVCVKTADNQNALGEFLKSKGVLVLNPNELSVYMKKVNFDDFIHLDLGFGEKLNVLYEYIEEGVRCE